MWTLRWLIVAIGVALGVVLVARGDVLIGAFVVVLASLRAAVFVQLQRRGRALRRRFPRRWEGPG